MANLFPTRDAIELSGQAVSDGLRNIMLLVRQIRTGGYEVTADGMGVVEGLIFMESKLLDDYLDQVKAILALVERLGVEGREAIKSIEETDAEIAELAKAIRQCLRFLAMPQSPSEAEETRQLIDLALVAIEDRLTTPEVPVPNASENVVQFPTGGSL